MSVLPPLKGAFAPPANPWVPTGPGAAVAATAAPAAAFPGWGAPTIAQYPPGGLPPGEGPPPQGTTGAPGAPVSPSPPQLEEANQRISAFMDLVGM